MKCLTSVTVSLSLLALALVPAPVKASVSCESGTVSSFANGSIQNCVLDQTMGMSTGVFSFDCNQGQSVSFDSRARLVSCTLGSSFSIRQGDGSLLNCQLNNSVSISYQDNGIQRASCY